METNMQGLFEIYYKPLQSKYGFPVVMYGCDSLTIKKAECRRIDAFELWW